MGIDCDGAGSGVQHGSRVDHSAVQATMRSSGDELDLALTVKQADTAYRLRSRLAHGAVTRVDADTLELSVAIERVLREHCVGESALTNGGTA